MLSLQARFRFFLRVATYNIGAKMKRRASSSEFRACTKSARSDESGSVSNEILHALICRSSAEQYVI